jgi:outer membrane immunogenic protein
MVMTKTWGWMAAGAALLLSAGAASSADLALKAAPGPAHASDCGRGQFQGFYVGGHGGWNGYQANRTDQDDFLESAATYLAKDGAASGGAQIGYNWQCRGRLLGIETDWSWTRATAETRLLPTATDIDLRATSKLNWYGTIRGRAGIVVDDILLYATAGLAYANIETTWRQDFGFGELDQFTFRDKRWGWTAGVGAEIALWSSWTLRSEALYIDLSDTSHTADSLIRGRLVSFTHSDSIWVSRVGLNFKFGGDPAPVHAKF